MRRFQKAETISTPLSFPFGLGANLTVTVVTKQKKLKRFYHNPRVGGSSPSSATISLDVINILQRLKKDLEALFALHTSYTLFGWLPVTPDYIVFIVIGCVRCLFCVMILC